MNFVKEYDAMKHEDGYEVFLLKRKEIGRIPLTEEGFKEFTKLDRENFESDPKLSVYIPRSRNRGYPKEVVEAWEADNSIYKAVSKIALSQDMSMAHTISILWNKCRYYEFTLHDKKLLKFVSQSAGVKIRYSDMLVGDRFTLERVVKALNKKGYYVSINQDWI